MPCPIGFGFSYDEDTDRMDPNLPVDYEGERHLVVFGVNGSGKSTRFLVPSLSVAQKTSHFVMDLKGELLVQTQRARRALGDDVKVCNPYGLHGVPSDGFNPLHGLDRDLDLLYDRAKLLAQAIVEEGDQRTAFFNDSARGWLTAGIMMEVIQAGREDRTPSLAKARAWCLQPDRWAKNAEGKEELVAGVSINARRAYEEGGALAELVVRFTGGNLQEMKSMQDVLNTLAVETEFLLSAPIARDLEKGDWDFAQLKEKPTCVYVVLPPEQLKDKRRWTRLLVSCALHAQLKPGKVDSLFILDEFRVSVANLPIVNDFWALLRGYGVRILVIAQSVVQLQATFGVEWENFSGQAGVVATIGPPGDLATAEWMSKRAGNRTIWQDGFNRGEREGQPGADRVTVGASVTQGARPLYLPQELMSLRVGSGMLWAAGMGDRCIPIFLPNYWKLRAIRDRVDPNPLYQGGAASANASGGERPAGLRRLHLAVALVTAAGLSYGAFELALWVLRAVWLGT
jgi:type IV secretion system protein VirD4